jgi:hypothetical protein
MLAVLKPKCPQCGQTGKVRYTYRRAGRWHVKIAVWDPYSGRWDLFDQATVTTG